MNLVGMILLLRIIENPPSPNDITFILENYFEDNNCNSLYTLYDKIY